MGARVAVAGASGYAGGELLRLLTAHPDLEIGPLAANSSAGLPVTAAHPQLTGYPGLDGAVFAGTDPDVLADADLLFTALPHGESAQLAARLPDHLRVIDLGADFRLADPGAWERYYPAPYAGQWAYGLPELPGARDAIRAAPRVAAPGCYATASILALAPLLAAGLADPADIVVVAASGTSGAGRSTRPGLLATEVMGSMSAYQVGGTHRHTPEIEQNIDPERAGVSAQRAGVSVLHADARPDGPRHPGYLHREVGLWYRPAARRAPRRLRRRTLRARAARGPVARPPAPPSAPTPPTCRWRPTRTPAAPSSSAPWTTWSRARPGRPSRSLTSCSACRRPPA